MNTQQQRIELYECRSCGAIHQSIVTECDCTVGEHFTYNTLHAYRAALAPDEVDSTPSQAVSEVGPHIGKMADAINATLDMDNSPARYLSAAKHVVRALKAAGFNIVKGGE